MNCPICGLKCSYLPKTFFCMKYEGKPSYQCGNCLRYYPVSQEEMVELLPKLKKAAEIMGVRFA